MIDLEEVEEKDNGRKVLKPNSRKFTATSILQSKFAQNWFFKNSDDEETDNLVREEESEEDKSRKTSTASKEEESESSILTKFKVVEHN